MSALSFVVMEHDVFVHLREAWQLRQSGGCIKTTHCAGKNKLMLAFITVYMYKHVHSIDEASE